MTGVLWLGIAGTVVLWAASGMLALALGLLLAAGSLGARRSIRLVSGFIIDLTRGVPTSLLVIAAGMGMMRVAQAPRVPALFPGTSASFQHVAWGVALALALGSAGHLAEVFCAAWATIGQPRLDQATLLGLAPWRRVELLVRESAGVAIPPTGARLTHHLHNTAFASFFPVADVFGHVQGQANATFRVIEFLLLGGAIYIALGGLAWIAFRSLESLLRPPAAAQRGGGRREWVLA